MTIAGFKISVWTATFNCILRRYQGMGADDLPYSQPYWFTSCQCAFVPIAGLRTYFMLYGACSWAYRHSTYRGSMLHHRNYVSGQHKRGCVMLSDSFGCVQRHSKCGCVTPV